MLRLPSAIVRVDAGYLHIVLHCLAGDPLYMLYTGDTCRLQSLYAVYVACLPIEVWFWCHDDDDVSITRGLRPPPCLLPDMSASWRHKCCLFDGVARAWLVGGPSAHPPLMPPGSVLAMSIRHRSLTRSSLCDVSPALTLRGALWPYDDLCFDQSMSYPLNYNMSHSVLAGLGPAVVSIAAPVGYRPSTMARRWGAWWFLALSLQAGRETRTGTLF